MEHAPAEGMMSLFELVAHPEPLTQRERNVAVSTRLCGALPSTLRGSGMLPVDVARTATATILAAARRLGESSCDLLPHVWGENTAGATDED